MREDEEWGGDEEEKRSAGVGGAVEGEGNGERGVRGEGEVGLDEEERACGGRVTD